MATTLPLDFQDFLKSLNSSNVEYLLIGGHAVMYYGEPRNTADMDIWIAVNPVNAQHVVEALIQFGFRGGVSADMFLKPDKIYRMGRPPLRIELLTSIS